MRIAVCISYEPAERWLGELRAAFPHAEVQAWDASAAGGTESLGLFDYAIVWAPPQRFIDEQLKLKAIFNTGAGVDALLKLQLPPALKLVRIEDAGMAVQMAEYVAHAVIRNFREFDALARDQAENKWAFRKPRVRSEFPVGVLGMGVLGARVAQAVAAFDFSVLGWSRSPREVPGVHVYSGHASLHGFLAATKILVCLLPLTDDTRDILNHANLSRLQPGGYVINVARGAHLVDEDLLALIDSGHLSGATLDVFRTEPLPADHPFWRHPAITVTPHASARTLRSESIAQIAGKIAAIERGQPITGVVDFGRGY